MKETKNRPSPVENKSSEKREREERNRGLARSWSLRNLASALQTDIKLIDFSPSAKSISTLSGRTQGEKTLNVAPIAAVDAGSALQELGLQNSISLDLGESSEISKAYSNAILTDEEIEERRAVIGYRWTGAPDRNTRDEVLYELTRHIQKADTSLDTLIEINRGLVRLYARKYSSTKAEYDEAEARGNIGLVTAAQKFDWRHGIHFGSYAAPVISGEMLHALRDEKRAVRTPREIFNDTPQIRKAIDLLMGSGRQVTATAIADELEKLKFEGMTEGRIAEVLLYEAKAKYPSSLNKLLYSQESNAPEELGSTLSDGSDFTQKIDGKIIVETVMNDKWLSSAVPNSRHRQAFMLHYVNGLNQTEIGRILGCSQMQVSRYIKRALLGIREHLE